MFHSTLQYTLLDYMKETRILLHITSITSKFNLQMEKKLMQKHRPIPENAQSLFGFCIKLEEDSKTLFLPGHAVG